jgi:outer membrane lipoprotein carrier protein
MRKIFLVLIFSFLIAGVNAQENTGLLKSVQQKFESLSDFSAEVKQIANGKSNFTGKVFFKKNDKFRVEFKNTVLVSDGSTTWNYNKKENKVIINEFDNSSPSALSFNTILNDYPAKCNVTESDENGKSVITLTPQKKSDLEFKEVKLLVNKNDLVEKVTVSQQGGNTMTIEISNYKLNQNIPDSQFSFSPPEGTTVIDLR